MVEIWGTLVGYSIQTMTSTESESKIDLLRRAPTLALEILNDQKLRPASPAKDSDDWGDIMKHFEDIALHIDYIPPWHTFAARFDGKNFKRVAEALGKKSGHVEL